MNNVNVKLTEEEAERVAHCMESIAEGVSAEDVIEIVLKSRSKKVSGETMTTKELAKAGRRQHATEFKRITKFLCTDATPREKDQFELDSFTIQHGGRSYPMYRMTEEGCYIYCDLLNDKMNYKTVAEAVEKMKAAIQEKFHADEIQAAMKEMEDRDFFFERKPREVYGDYSKIYEMFIDHSIEHGREIAELTDSYDSYVNKVQNTDLPTPKINGLMFALYDVAMDAEKQGFIYGLRTAEMLLAKRFQAVGG